MIKFRISNMTCGGCAKGVAATLKAASIERELRFDLERRELQIVAAPSESERLMSALNTDGWHAEVVAD